MTTYVATEYKESIDIQLGRQLVCCRKVYLFKLMISVDFSQSYCVVIVVHATLLLWLRLSPDLDGKHEAISENCDNAKTGSKPLQLMEPLPIKKTLL